MSFNLEFLKHQEIAERIQYTNPYRINFLDLYLNNPNHEIFQNQNNNDIVFSGRIYVTGKSILVPRSICQCQLNENQVHDLSDRIFISSFCQK